MFCFYVVFIGIHGGCMLYLLVFMVAICCMYWYLWLFIGYLLVFIFIYWLFIGIYGYLLVIYWYLWWLFPGT